jgi:hypothetical protein
MMGLSFFPKLIVVTIVCLQIFASNNISYIAHNASLEIVKSRVLTLGRD